VPGTAFSTVVDGRAFYQPEYASRRCRRCNLVYKSRIASSAELREYYERVDFQKWEYPDFFPTERRVLAALQNLPRQSRILDFGCSSGRLLNGLIPNYACFGCEVNESAAKKAAARGISIVSWEEIVERSTVPSFDAIVLVDVFEHLTRPLELLKLLVGRINTGGRLILCTGDSDAPAVRGEPSTFWYFRNIEHVCMLNRQHVAYLADELRLNVVRVEQVCHYDVTIYQRIRRAVANFAYEVFHRGKAVSLQTALRFLPGFRKAPHWQERPQWSTTADHLVVLFEKLN
jgi:SAM-dependent methyltransferase